MGHNWSLPILAAKSKRRQSKPKSKSPRGGSSKGKNGSSGGFSLPSWEIFTVGVKTLAEGYTILRNGQVERGEIKKNGQAFRDAIPAVTTLVNNVSAYVKTRRILDIFSTFLMGANTVAYWVEVLHGDDASKEIGKLIHGELEARTGLEAPSKFAQQVKVTIRQQVASGVADDIFFLYHPDTDWHGWFFEFTRTDPLPTNFLGMSENLDAIVIWMMFLRRHLEKSAKKHRFHLIVPAYRPMLIKDPLIFPAELYPFTIHGLVHNSRPLVWFDLPTINDVPAGSFDLQHIGNLSNPPSEWRHAAAAAAGVATAGVGIITAGALTVATAPVIGPLAGAIWLAGGGASMLAGAKAADRVDRMFERPNPRLIGQRQGGGVRGGVEGGMEAERDDFRFQPTTRRVSRNPSRGRRHGQHHRR